MEFTFPQRHIIYYFSPKKYNYPPVKVSKERRRRHRRQSCASFCPTFSFLCTAKQTWTKFRSFLLGNFICFLSRVVVFGAMAELRLTKKRKNFGKRGSTSLLRDVSHECWPQMNELRDWTWRALETKGKLFILYEDSFSCVCVLTAETGLLYYFFFLSFIILLSLSRVICAQPSGRQRPALFIPLYHYSSTARSRIREWHPSHKCRNFFIFSRRDFDITFNSIKQDL